MPRKLCVHGKQKYYCKECGSGKAFCSHGKVKYRCKDCNGKAYCIHEKEKKFCIECHGNGLCSHGKRKRTCGECHGSKRKEKFHCPHGKKRKNQCPICIGHPIIYKKCPHGRQCKSRCPECLNHSISFGKCSRCRQAFTPDKQCTFNGKPLQTCENCRYKCPHGKRNRSSCPECTKLSKYCAHQKQKYRCRICNPNGHLRHIVECDVRRALRAKKSKCTIEYLGCSIEEFRKYIESQLLPGMTWENYGKVWHIDHIIPVEYNKPTIEQAAQRLHYMNTQPLWASDNLIKYNNLRWQDAEKIQKVMKFFDEQQQKEYDKIVSRIYLF